jgi:DNA-binding CsgD family transcriptional regulator/tetratricopeptide (TPR) repeat protein
VGLSARLNGVVLLERDALLGRLDGLVDEAVATRGHLVFLGGEAGVGKTTVVRALQERATERLTVRVGHCDNVAASAALGPLVDALPETAEDTDAEVVRPVLFRRLRQRLAAEPTLLVLEDMHWADEATLDFLRFLGRRLDDLGLLVVVTYRDDEVLAGHQLAVVLGDLTPSAGVDRMSVAPLSIAAVRELASAARSPLDVASLHERTGGNAFYVTEVLAAADDDVPATVRDAVLARASRLSEDARAVLSAAAVLGQPADLGLLVAVSGRVDTAVDECVTAGLLVGDGRTWGFRHDLARLAVDETLLPTQRAALHASALQALRDTGADDHRLAFHAAGCGDDATVLRHAIPAAERSARLGAHREAAELYRLAVRAHPARDTERARLCAALSYECYLTNQIDEAHAARLQSLELSEEPLLVGDSQRWLSRLAWYLGRNDESETYAERAISTLQELGETRELAMAYSNMAQLRMLGFDGDATVLWGRKAIDLARRLGDQDTEIHALNNIGAALALTGDYLEGMTRLEQSRDLALAADAHEHVARAYTNLGSSSVTRRVLGEAERNLDAGIAYCIERDLDSWRYYMTSWRARLFAEQGHYDEAHALAVDVLGLPHLPAIVRIPAAVVAAQVDQRRGQDGSSWLSEATELARPTGEPQRLAPVAVARAELAWLQGRSDDIEAAVDIVWSMITARAPAFEVGELRWWLAVAGGDRPSPAPAATPFQKMLDGAWHEAADEWRSIGCPYWTALSLAHAPDLDAAREALQIIDGLPAPAVRAAVVRDRHDKGLPVPRGPRSTTGTTSAGLTARELDVLALLGDGLSDADIASALFLSRKTVGHHVSAVLRKLEAPSRSRAVATATRRGILRGSDTEPGLSGS